MKMMKTVVGILLVRLLVLLMLELLTGLLWHLAAQQLLQTATSMTQHPSQAGWVDISLLQLKLLL
jgi:flagellar basal body-associated protein FliL